MADHDPSEENLSRELSLEEAALMLGGPVALLKELLDVGAIPHHITDGALRVQPDDIAAYLSERARRRVHLREIAKIVDESAGGWDHP